MGCANLATLIESQHQEYLEQKRAIEQRLRQEIEHFRSELHKHNPHSHCEVERWTAGVYQSLVERRTNLMRMLFAENQGFLERV